MTSLKINTIVADTNTSFTQLPITPATIVAYPDVATLPTSLVTKNWVTSAFTYFLGVIHSWTAIQTFAGLTTTAPITLSVGSKPTSYSNIGYSALATQNATTTVFTTGNVTTVYTSASLPIGVYLVTGSLCAKVNTGATGTVTMVYLEINTPAPNTTPAFPLQSLWSGSVAFTASSLNIPSPMIAGVVTLPIAGTIVLSGAFTYTGTANCLTIGGAGYSQFWVTRIG